MLLSLERINAKALLFTRLIATLLKSFHFFFNCIARYAQSKESRNLPTKNSQITRKATLEIALNIYSHLSQFYVFVFQSIHVLFENNGR